MSEYQISCLREMREFTAEASRILERESQTHQSVRSAASMLTQASSRAHQLIGAMESK